MLIRHATNDFVKTGKLAGWTADVHLNDDGRVQAAALGRRLANVKIDAIYSSPLERTVETAQAILEHHPDLQLQLLETVGEVRYGLWQGQEISKLAQRKMWRVVQMFPSRARFPGGETMREAQMRAVNAIEMLVEKHPRQTVAVVSHSDMIKMIVAHYLGMHLDMFQRIEVSPASLTILSLGYSRPTVVQINETSYLPQKPKKREINAADVKPVQSITVDAVGEPANRTFYLQAQDRQGAYLSLLIEKTQAILIADQVEELLKELALPPSEDDNLPALHNPEDVLFRAGELGLQYESDSDLYRLDIRELRGKDQGEPDTLTLWTTRQQLRALGRQARQVASRGLANG